ncbi:MULTISPECIES: alpha/beta hydrolase family protein [Aminobacterium]|jgi:cephalosporin-C deacetylase-like acetyl esterase|uniref:Dipeptidylaminopeptidase/acylaminoacyl-peptidase-like protein n=1 Tax=Aminobacterium colombiense (strain DSM 12261 / ALA-1) TaxID=572547 RepID=D5EGP0_AMICL|nr:MULTISPECIES: alpha/beta fold hydrolase [Aminobacterium]MDD2378589.1 alpha/beta fold hydrolase [Aminobacterium colombiense]ADE57722.1 Dipeptidylaminopeptidase/acylaminoacyl-peptidase-like protein [Aminobacterium colombiense DSM 12261]MDD3768077.1 alpha/beta fold hydrolase [Aminobacterium colombiense]MDD4266093.1 alpha/beta fold hydrolase [Aminobacterium colombiense]MDD4585267.1 alpha/beta fold hydrolase [Aminobacterium colombiense]
MYRPCIEIDPEIEDWCYPPSMEALDFVSEGSHLYGVIYIAQGIPPHPTILFLHGFPGTEKNLDLAQVLRRAGFNTVVFSYRGCWGSQGFYSFSHVISDSINAVRYLQSDFAQKNYGVDPERILIFGHSMGGFAMAKVADAMPGIRDFCFISGWNLGFDGKNGLNDSESQKKLDLLLKLGAPPLHGTNKEALLEEIRCHLHDWDIVNSASSFINRNILVLGAKNDNITPLRTNHAPFVEALRKYNNEGTKEIIMNTDHSYSDCRVALAGHILDWLESLGY